MLKGFKIANIHIHLLSDDLDKLQTKSKFNDLFDIGVFSIYSSGKIEEKVNYLFKKGAKVHVETADYLVQLSKTQRPEYRVKLQDKAAKAGWREVKDAPYSHHMLFEVDKDESLYSKSTAASTMDDDLNLDDLQL